jgi:hypothetical protein
MIARLMSYGTSILDAYQQAGINVERQRVLGIAGIAANSKSESSGSAGFRGATNAPCQR